MNTAVPTSKVPTIEIPTIKDAAELLNFFTTLVAVDPERVERNEDVSKITLEKEQQWIEGLLRKQEAGDLVVRIIRNSSNSIIGLGEVERRPRWIERHVAEIRFGLQPEHSAEGTALVQELEAEARRIGIEVLYYFHLATQTQGLQIMRECGYSDAGEISGYYYRNGEYIDRVILQKKISTNQNKG